MEWNGIDRSIGWLVGWFQSYRARSTDGTGREVDDETTRGDDDGDDGDDDDDGGSAREETGDRGGWFWNRETDDTGETAASW